MLDVECNSCQVSPRCPRKGDHHRQTLFAWAQDQEGPECHTYAPRLWRGVPGVIDLPAPHQGAGR